MEILNQDYRETISDDEYVLKDGSGHEEHEANEDDTHEGGSTTSPKTKRSAKDRIALACHKCRQRRAKCTGERPVCSACAKLGYECTWPPGRRRKRTRAEMQAAAQEEDRKLVRTGSSAMQSNVATNSLNDGPMIFPTPKGSGRSFGSNSEGSVSSPNFLHNNLYNFPVNQIDQPKTCASTAHDHVMTSPSMSLVNNAFSTPAFTWPPVSTGSSFEPTTPGQSPFDMLNAQPLPHFNFGLPTNATYDLSQQADLLRALESQPAIVEGDPAKNGRLDLYYYRFSGSTAFHPGINRINLTLRIKDPASASPLDCNAPEPETSSSAVVPVEASPSFFQLPMNMFDETGMPVPEVANPLLDLFFSTTSLYFPSIHRRRMEERMQSGTMSAFMLNCICAISARFQPSAQKDPTKACTPFITKAQELLVPLIHFPTTDACTGLLLLAWASWGQDSESGLWLYAGLAFRMAIDLGIHEESEIYESEAHVVRTRLLFWTLFITDRLISFSTGRPVTISEEMIEIPMPTDADFTPSPTARGDETERPPGPIPFVQLVRLMVLVGRINNVLNGRRGQKRTLVAASDPSPNLLSELQTQVIELYRGIPSALKWSVDAFKHYEGAGHGGTFLMLHLWINAVLTLTYHPELLQTKSGAETPTQATLHRSLRLSMSSARLINDALVFADLASSQSYTSVPMVVQPIFVAALAFIHEMRIADSGLGFTLSAKDGHNTGTDAFLASLDRQSLFTLNKALQRIEHYWAGVSFVTNILHQKEAGVFKVDPEAKAKKAAISLPDRGLLRRFVAADPSVAPATDTSLRASIAAEKAKKESASMSGCLRHYYLSILASDFLSRDTASLSLEDLFNQYNVSNISFSPGSSYDVAQLLASSIPTWNDA